MNRNVEVPSLHGTTFVTQIAQVAQKLPLCLIEILSDVIWESWRGNL